MARVSHGGAERSSIDRHGGSAADAADRRGRAGGVPPAARLLAIGALVLIPLGLASMVFGFVRGLPGLAVSLLLFAAAGALSWVALGRRRWRRFGFLVPAAMAAGGAIWSAADSGRQLLWIGVGALVELVGSAAGRSALLMSPRPSRHRMHRPTAVPHHPVLFVNPHSGDGTAARVGLADVGRQRGIAVHELAEGDDLASLARHAVDDGADCLGAAGGDGTLAQVALVCIERDVPFVCVPAGTRNHFALDLGLDRSDPVGALGAFGDAYEKRIDVGDVNGSIFLNNVSIGAYGEIVADEQYRERKIATALSKLPELIGPDAEPLDLRFTDPAGDSFETAVVIHVSNNSYELSPRPGFGSRPSLSDGELGVVAVVPGGGIAGPLGVLRWEAPRFRIDSGGEVLAGLDGEARQLDPPVEFRIRPGVLTVRIPIDAVGVSPAALRPRLSLTTFDRMASLALGRRPAA